MRHSPRGPVGVEATATKEEEEEVEKEVGEEEEVGLGERVSKGRRLRPLATAFPVVGVLALALAHLSLRLHGPPEPPPARRVAPAPVVSC